MAIPITRVASFIRVLLCMSWVSRPFGRAAGYKVGALTPTTGGRRGLFHGSGSSRADYHNEGVVPGLRFRFNRNRKPGTFLTY